MNLPPYPAQATPGDYIWVDWWKKLQDFMQQTANAANTNVKTLTGTGVDNTDPYNPVINIHLTDLEIFTPATGSTVSPLNTTSFAYLNPATTLANLAVVLPATCITGDGCITINTSRTVSALSLSAIDSIPIVGAITTLSAGGFAKYKRTDTQWIRVG